MPNPQATLVDRGMYDVDHAGILQISFGVEYTIFLLLFVASEYG